MINRSTPNHHVLLHEELKLVLFLTPKAGNTSIKESIFKAMGSDLGYEIPLGFKFIEPEDVSSFEFDQYKKVAVVRNPYTRLMSCYKDKIKGRDLEEGSLLYGWNNDIRTGMSFNDFVVYVSRATPYSINMHARPQLYEIESFCNPNDVDIFKFEDITRDFQDFKDYFLTNFGLILPPLKKRNESQSSDDLQYDKFLKYLIEQRYHEDLKYFNYKFEY